MKFPFSHAKKEKIIAILDIGSASVGGAVVSLKEDENPKILFSVREDMVFQNDLNLKRFLSSMVQTLEHVLKKIKKEKELPQKFFCVLSSPWHDSTTKKIVVEKDTPFIVSNEILDDLINKEAKAFRASMDEKGKVKKTDEIINIQNIQIKLNGYETSHPYNKKAQKIETTLFIALGSKKILEVIKGKVSNFFHSSDLVFNTFSLSAFSTIRDIFTDKHDFLFLDISGEVTDISMIKENVLVDSVSFPLGKNFTMRRIANDLNTPIEEVKSLFNMVRMKKSDEVTQARLENALRGAQKEWLISFTKAIAIFSKKYTIPGTIFFTADPELAEWIVGFMKEEEFGQFMLADEKFDINFLNEDILGEFCSFKKGVEKDPFIILEAIFASRSINIF